MNEKMIYVPLGGAGEIGMNMYAYGFGAKGKERWIIIDAGVTFPDAESTPGVDLIMADPEFLVDKVGRIEAVFITHAHEDHVGAIGMLLSVIGPVPVYARTFTAEIARGKMERFNQDSKLVHEVGAYPERIELGSFSVAFVPISHSIPEASGMLVEAGDFKIFHTGDFKCDETPLIGEAFSDELFQEIGAMGIDALMCDSTNVFSKHEGRSEATLEDPIRGLIADAKGMVVATTFASNLARVRTLARAGVAAGRKVIVVGRAMNTMISAGHKTGVIPDFPPVQGPDTFDQHKRSDVLIIATGSQGEYRAATAQLARGNYMGIKPKSDDLFLFSSKTIPGNEISVSRVMNDLAILDVDIVSDDDRFHVSGHANRPDLTRMHKLIQPKVVVPMHGEFRHLREHRKLAIENGFEGVLAPNGVVISIDNAGVQVVDQTETGRRYLDGSVLIGARDGVVRERIQLSQRGHLGISITVDEKTSTVEDVWVLNSGLNATDSHGREMASALEEELLTELNGIGRKTIRDDDALDQTVQKISRRIVNDLIGKKPVMTVFIQRVE